MIQMGPTTTLVGVDGGGTKTRVSVFDPASGVYGAGSAGPGNYHNVGVDEVSRNIGSAWREACSTAGIECRHAAAAYIGLGSVVSDDDRRRIHRVGAELGLAPSEFIGVGHDLRVAAAGAFPETEGVVLVAGTGSAAYGVTRDGRSWRSGGWGPTIDDGGSAYWLGVEALRAVVMAHDGRRPATRLTREVMTYFGVTDHNELMFLIDGQPGARRRIAGLATRVTALAAEGEEVAVDIVRRGVVELVRCVEAVRSNLSMSATPLRVALAGGMSQAGLGFLEPLAAALAERIPGSQLVEPALPPADGALLLAAERVGHDVRRQTLNTLTQRTNVPQASPPPPHSKLFGSAAASAELTG